MILGELLTLIGEPSPDRASQVRIHGIAYDSRRVKPGDLFVALQGEHADGVRFVPQALERGALAVAAEAKLDLPDRIASIRVSDARGFLALAARIYHGDPTASLKLAAVTGTNGKTTTTYLIDSIFRQAGLRSCMAGTTGMRIGQKQVPTDRTTPEAPETMLFLRHAVNAGCTHGSLEVSSHALALKRVFGARFTLGVFTNLTPDHLDFHKDMEAYYRAKRLLFVQEGGNQIEAAAINNDDPAGRRLSEEISCPVLRYGFGADAEVRPLEVRQETGGTRILLALPQGEIEIQARLLGKPNAYNMLAAAAASSILGMKLEEIRRGIEALEGIPGRMESVAAGQPFLVLVDYAHTPDALEKTIETVHGLPHGRVITLFGCGGDRDRGKRPVMGAIAARMSDFVIATSDNPRTEDPRRILAEIEEGLRCGPAPYELIPDRREAIAAAIARARENDVVLIAGKGHETYQVIGTQAFPFDDREMARGVLLKIPEARGARP